MNNIQQNIKEYLKERGWSPNPAQLAKSISIESAELLEIFQWDDISTEELKNNPQKLEALKGEVADVCIYAIQIAIALDENILDIIQEKLEKVKKKYPAEEIKQNRENYFKIKNEYRKNAK